MLGSIFGRSQETVECTVDVSNTFDSLHAHVRFDGGVTVAPGDAVTVHGEPVVLPYGERAEFRRLATIRRAGPIERAWTRMTGDFEFMELCEFSFSERATL